MKRCESRITLELTGKDIQPLCDISENDAIDEGFNGQRWSIGHGDYAEIAPSEEFRDAWKTINGEFSWDKNPYVWVIEFKRVESQGDPDRERE